MAAALPRIFQRRRPPLTPPFVGSRHPLDNVFAAGDVPPVQPQEPVKLNPPLPAIPADESGEDYRQNYGPPPQYPEPQLPNMPAPPPMVLGDKYGVPKRSGVVADPDDEEAVFNQAARDAKPKAAKGWWDRWLKPALKGAGIGFLHGGLGGAIGGAAANTLRSAFDSASPNKDRLRGVLQESDANLAGIGQQRKLERDENIANATLQNRQLDTALKIRKLNEKPPQRNVQTGTATLPDGRTVQVERDEQGVWQLSKDKDGQPVVRKPAPDPKAKKVVVDVPGVGQLEVTQESALDYYSTAENRGQQRQGAADEAAFNNEQIQRNISEIETEKVKVEDALRNTAKEIEIPILNPIDGSPTGRTKTARNPEYDQLERRRDKLIDDARQAREKLKAIPKVSRTGRSKKPATVPASRLLKEFDIQQ